MKFVSEPITKVGPNEAVVIANDTTSKLSVATGLIFYESGRYDICIQGNVVTVSKAPSEVIFCKDCTWYLSTHCGRTKAIVTDMDYCSFGERKHKNETEDKENDDGIDIKTEER